MKSKKRNALKTEKSKNRLSESQFKKRKMRSRYAHKHADQLRGIFNETSPLQPYRIQRVDIKETGHTINRKV